MLDVVQTQGDLAGIVPELEAAERPVPKREHARVVGVGLGLVVGVVNPMHPRSHDQPTQRSIDPGRKPDIAVMKENDGQENYLIHEELLDRQTQQRKHGQSNRPR